MFSAHLVIYSFGSLREHVWSTCSMPGTVQSFERRIWSQFSWGTY